MNENTPTPSTQKAFIVRVNPGSQVALDHNVIGIGWDRLTEIDPSWTWNELKSKIREVYKYPSERAVGNVAGSIERFCLQGPKRLEVNDYVLMPVDRAFHLGIVKSEIKRCDDSEMKGAHLQWQRDVEWLTKSKGPIPRSAVDNELEIRLKSRQTCIDASDCIKHIEAVRNSDYTVVSFKDLVREKSKQSVIEALKSINDRRLEKLIRALCFNVGATVLPKNDSSAGDADVQADYSVMIGKEKYFVRVLYQAKKHTGTTGKHGIQQLIDRIKTLNEDASKKEANIIIYKGCLVTTADRVSVAAEELASGMPDQSEIEIIALDDLVEWILDAGISNLNV